MSLVTVACGVNVVLFAGSSHGLISSSGRRVVDSSVTLRTRDVSACVSLCVRVHYCGCSPLSHDVRMCVWCMVLAAASYGGVGSTGAAGGTGPTACGSLEWPGLTLGSGGFSYNYAGGNGGGAIVLLANATSTTYAEINGTIRVNGNAGAGAGSGDSSWCGGGGAGGSLTIEASLLTGAGSGLIQALGGAGGNSVQYGRHGGSGSGGRVSLNVVSSTYAGSVSAWGGAAVGGLAAGAPGTVFWSVGEVRASRTRRLVIDNNNRVGGHAMLTDSGRDTYVFDVVSLSNVGRLAWNPASIVLSQASSLVVTSLLGDASSSGRVTVQDLTILVLPTTYTISGMEVVVAGTLSGVTSLTMDGTSALTLTATGRTSGQSSSVFSFSSLTLKTNSLMTATSPTVFTVANTVLVQDTSRIVLNSLSGLRLTVSTLDLAPTAYVTFSGSIMLEVTVSLLLRAGSYISGDGGGFSAGLGCGVTGVTVGSGGAWCVVCVVWVAGRVCVVG